VGQGGGTFRKKKRTRPAENTTGKRPLEPQRSLKGGKSKEIEGGM